MRSKNGKMDVPLLIMETQNYCNLVNEERACKHCSVDDYVNPSKCGDKVDWNEVVSQFVGLNGSGHVVLKNGAGALGEIEMSLLEQVLESGLSTSVTTEGACMPSGFKSSLFDLGQKYEGALGVTVSLEGATKEIYGQLRDESLFDGAVAFIKEAKANGLEVGVNYVVHAGNVGHLKEYVGFVVDELGVDKVNLLELNVTGGAKRNGLEIADPETYFKVLTDVYVGGREAVKLALKGTFAAAVDEYVGGGKGCRGCPAGSQGMAHVNHKGEIHPCSSLEGLSQYNAGVVSEITLSEAMESTQFAYARKVAESLAEGNPVVSMCPGRLESFGDLGQLDKATDLTRTLTGYLEEKGVDHLEMKGADNGCHSPAF